MALRFLVVGAGVIGSALAHGMALAGVDVTLVARGERRAVLDAHGVTLSRRGEPAMSVHVPTVGGVSDGGPYDFALVTVPAHRVSEAVRQVAATDIANVVVMANTFTGYDEWTEVLGERLMTAFPAFGGGHDFLADSPDAIAIDVPKFPLDRLQQTVIGDDENIDSHRVALLRVVFKRSGFPAVAQENMRGWLRAHAAWVGPFAQGVRAAGGDRWTLAVEPEILDVVSLAIHEALNVVREEDDDIAPNWLELFDMYPKQGVLALRKILEFEAVEHLLIDHAMDASQEMNILCDQIRAEAELRGLPTDGLARLRHLADAA